MYMGRDVYKRKSSLLNVLVFSPIYRILMVTGSELTKSCMIDLPNDVELVSIYTQPNDSEWKQSSMLTVVL